MNALRFDLNDNELLYMIRTEDSKAFQMMLEKYENYIQILLDRFSDGTLSEQREDISQECRILLRELCLSYREDMGCRFLTYLVNGIRNCVYTRQKKERRKANYGSHISLDCCVRDGDSDSALIDFIDCKVPYFQPEFEWRYAESVQKLKMMFDTLSENERKIWQMMNDTISYEDAAKKLGLTRKQFDNQRLRLKKKIVFCIMKPDKTHEEQ